MGDSGPSNMRNFTENSYNLTGNNNSWCVKKGSAYTNPNSTINYFSSKCEDPYTAYSYWYRRFPDQTAYLNCYNLPYRDVLLANKTGYLNKNSSCNKLSTNKRFNKVSGGFKFYDTKINGV